MTRVVVVAILAGPIAFAAACGKTNRLTEGDPAAGNAAPSSQSPDAGGRGGTSGGADGRDAGSAGGTGGTGGAGNTGGAEAIGTCGGLECSAGEACCLATAECFDPEEQAEACVPEEDPPGEPGLQPCASNLDCDAGEVCWLGGANGCTGSGRCQPRDDCGECSGEAGACEVCGCNGVTFPDIQTACLAGVRVSGHGACGEAIPTGYGGEHGIDDALVITHCGSDEHCGAGERCCVATGECYDEDAPYLCGPPPDGSYRRCLDDADCYPADFCKRTSEGCQGEGGCVNSGSDCSGVLEPVCGCDGQSYTNAECAQAAGTNVAHQGECEE